MSLTALVPVTLSGVLSVRVVRDRPRIASVFPKDAPAPEAHDILATEHALVSLVARASRGRRWDVVPAHGHDERGHLFAGAELILDRLDYAAKREGEVLLSEVAAALEALG